LFYKKSKEQGLYVSKTTKKMANEPQEYWLHRGLLLIAYLPTIKKGIHNGQLLECTGFTETMVSLKDFERPEITMELPIDFVTDYLRLAYAFTGYGAQGRTLGNYESVDEPERGITVWTDHPKFTSRALFTATSRSRSGDLLQVR